MQKAEQMQVNHLPPLLWAVLRSEPRTSTATDLMTPTAGWGGFNAIKQRYRRQILDSRRQRTQTV